MAKELGLGMEDEGMRRLAEAEKAKGPPLSWNKPASTGS